MIEVRSVSGTFRQDVVTDRLIELLSDALSSGDEVDERLLLQLLCQKCARDSREDRLEVFSNLRLKKTSHLRSMEFDELRFLYKQLMKVGRRHDASRVAVIRARSVVRGRWVGWVVGK